MKTHSLRARLTLWHAALLGVTLVVLAGLTLVLLKQYLYRRADGALYEYADTTARGIAAALYHNSISGAGLHQHFLNKELEEWGRQIQIIDQYGNAYDRSDGLASHPLHASLTARLAGQSGSSTFETRYDLGEYPVRVVTVPVMMGSQVPYMVMAATSLEGIEAALSRAMLILAVLTPGVFVVSLVGGWLLVGRSLQPVDEITRTALSIEHTNLDRRISRPGANDEISRLASAFNEMIARLDRSFRQMKQFSADASHELRTPLTTLRGEAEVALMSERTPAEYRATLKTVVDEAARMAAIVENLLLLAQADADQIQLRREPIELHGLALGVFEQMEFLAEVRGVDLVPGDMEEVQVAGDPLWLTQIVTNLLQNAIKYTPAGGRVTLSVTECRVDERSTGCVTVTDTGPGIAQEHLAHIFDRFYRTDAGRARDAGGAGLGLNIARWAAEAHGGTIVVQSTPGKGSAFTLQVPVRA